MKGLNWVIVVAGVWEIFAPFLLGFGNVTAGVWNNIVVGIILIVLGAWAAVSNNAGTTKTLDWIAAVVGLWMVISPFILGTSAMAAALWNDILVGLVALVCGAWAAMSTHQVTV